VIKEVTKNFVDVMMSLQKFQHMDQIQ